MNITASSPSLLNIAAVERETGLLKDTLRVWERRYGFPTPIRDDAGERLYTREQVDRLRLICRLMDQGWRPGKLLALPPEELDALIAADRSTHTPTLLSGELAAALRAHDVDALRRTFQTVLLEKGLKGLITELIAPLNVDIGEAWLRGDLGVPDEHFYTEQVQTFLRGALASYPRPGKPPRVLLTTLPEEEHGLGLLMVEVMLSAEGAHCCSLGPRMPLTDIVRAAQTADADVVALSFSAAFPARQALEGLRALRASLPPTVELWVGGAGAPARIRGEPGVSLIRDIAELPLGVADWRTRH